MKKAVEARDTMFEIADFFHAVAHTRDIDISKGMAIKDLAKQAGIAVPRSLRGMTVKSIGSKSASARTRGPELTVSYDQPKRGTGTAEFKKCVTVGTTSGPVTGNVKVCIDCSIRKLKCVITIEITGTITIG
jgi:hypothetical protein